MYDSTTVAPMLNAQPFSAGVDVSSNILYQWIAREEISLEQAVVNSCIGIGINGLSRSSTKTLKAAGKRLSDSIYPKIQPFINKVQPTFDNIASFVEGKNLFKSSKSADKIANKVINNQVSPNKSPLIMDLQLFWHKKVQNVDINLKGNTQDEIRNRVLKNIETSKLGREASDYKKFADFENSLRGVGNRNVYDTVPNDAYAYQQYKKLLMKDEIINNSKQIINGKDLWDPKTRTILTSDGTDISDWWKMESKKSYSTEFGEGKIHYYQNKNTGAVSSFDAKLKVPKPKNLRANPKDLFWIIDLDADFVPIKTRW